MKILIATDAFKDALPGLEVCEAIRRGIQKTNEKINVRLFPLGDGGEGTAKILTWHSEGKQIQIPVHDPLSRLVDAAYGMTPDGGTAFIEMAEASGLQLLQSVERNCWSTSTLGTGELIMDAIRRGAQTIIMGIGGSATNDVGIGMATALGYRFLNQNGKELRPIGGNLSSIQGIEDGVVVDLRTIDFQILCDVDNPLFGPEGAVYTYARQKGAEAKDLELLDQGVRHFSAILNNHFGKDFSEIPGAGAAGGLGAGAMAFLKAKLFSGINFVLDYTNFDAALATADLVITGEGKIDAQTLRGKLICGITKRAKKYEVPVLALCGALEANPEQIQEMGLQAAYAISKKELTLEEAIEKTAENLERVAFEVISFFSSRGRFPQSL